MSTYVLIAGAGGSAWYWHRVVPLFVERGHDVVAADLPADDRDLAERLEALREEQVSAARCREAGRVLHPCHGLRAQAVPRAAG